MTKCYRMNLLKLVVLLMLIIIMNLRAQTSLLTTNSWAYQLQNIYISQIANNTTFDLIVIDYSNDGSEEERFTTEEISLIKNSGKKIISYISIGEAETYRFYWDNSWDADNDGIPDPSAPEWLGNENPDWEGNYKVRFWIDEWQEIIFSYIDTIYAQGFDGIYMDIIDGYYYWMEENAEEPQADVLMIQFISKIREHINASTNSDFYIIPQNGEYIIEELNVTDELKDLYFNSIDAIGIEDLFFIGEEDENNSFNPDYERVDILQQFLHNEKQVFSVEYLTNTNLIEQYITEAEQYNFVPYVSTRALDVLYDGIPLFIENVKLNIFNSFILHQNYPNPFNPLTTIRYILPKRSVVELSIFNILGEKVAVLVNQEQQAGSYDVKFNAGSYPSGIYFYRIETPNFIDVKKMIYLK